MMIFYVGMKAHSLKILLMIFLDNGHPLAIGQHAPDPFQRTEMEAAQPQTTYHHFGQEGNDGDDFNDGKAAMGAKAETDAIEQQDADERLADIA